MNKMKQELAKKKKIDINSDGGSRQFTKFTSYTASSSKETVRKLNQEEKNNLIKRIKKNKNSVIHGGDTDSEDDEDNMNPFETRYNSYGENIKKSLTTNTSSASYSSRNKFTDTLAAAAPSPSADRSHTAALERKRQAMIQRVKGGGGGGAKAGWQSISGSLVGLKEGAPAKTTLEKNAVREPHSGIFVM